MTHPFRLTSIGQPTARRRSFDRSLVLAALVLATAACVTVNVNFPEGAVQKATDDYVRELYRSKPKGAPAAAPSPSAPRASLKPTTLVSAVLNALVAIPEARADGEISIPRSAAAQAATERMQSRLEQVLRWKRAGALGETQDGKLVVRQPASGQDFSARVAAKQFQDNAARVQALADAENADRTAIYNEFARENGLREDRMANVQRSFARSFQSESPSGTPVEGTDGNWSRKP